MIRLRRGAAAALVALVAWGAGAAAQVADDRALPEPTRGVPLYLGTVVAAAVTLFLAPHLRGVRVVVGWGFASAAVAASGVAIARVMASETSLPMLPGYIVHELPASALGVTLLIAAAGASPALRVYPEATSRSSRFLLTTLLRCVACLLLLLAATTHTIWLSTWGLERPGGFIGFVSRALVPTMMWVGSFVHLLATARWPAGPVVKGGNVLVVGAAWTALAAAWRSEVLAFVLVLASCSIVALAFSGSRDAARRVAA